MLWRKKEIVKEICILSEGEGRRRRINKNSNKINRV